MSETTTPKMPAALFDWHSGRRVRDSLGDGTERLGVLADAPFWDTDGDEEGWAVHVQFDDAGISEVCWTDQLELVEETASEAAPAEPPADMIGGASVKHCQREEYGVVIGDPYWSEENTAWFVRLELEQGEVEVTAADWIVQPNEPSDAAADDPPPMIPGDPDEPKAATQPTISDDLVIIDGRTISTGEIAAIMRKERRLAALAKKAAEKHSDYVLSQQQTNALREEWKKAQEELANEASADAQLRIPGITDEDERDPGILSAREEGSKAAADGLGVEKCPYDHQQPQRRQDWQMGWKAKWDELQQASPAKPKQAATDRVINGPELGLDAKAMEKLGSESDNLKWDKDRKKLPKLSKAACAFALYDRPWIVVDYLTDGDDDGGTIPENHEAFEARPLYDGEEWDQMHGEAIGKPVETCTDPRFDDLELEHGVHAGRRVKHGRRKMVIGPQADRVYVVFPIGADTPADDDGDDEGLSADDAENGEIVDNDPLGVGDEEIV